MSESTMDKTPTLTVDDIKELTWVQCENETCLKWRRINREEVGKLGDKPWFCHMNTDTTRNKCDVPEEDHRKTINTANRCGYRYIFSKLPQGALVWAKMTGYVRWPAILSPDPSDGDYVTVNDKTDSPSKYHVEFLGQPHSHCWVSSGDVEVYGTSCTPKPPQKVSKRGKRSNKTVYKFTKNDKYSPKSLQYSIEEAELLKAMTCIERLAKCIFIYKPKTDPPPVNTEITVSKSKNESRILQENEAISKKRGRPPRTQECDNIQNNAKSSKKLKKDVSFCSHPNVVPVHGEHTGQYLSSSANEASSSDQEVPMVIIRTKEERLQADIQLLKNAEEKFERHLRKFAWQHGLSVKSTGPQWQGRQISRYQVYMAVQERGGYNAVNAERAWARIYHEVCGTSPSGSCQSVSSKVKSFYTRILLPYELYEMQSCGKYDVKSTSKTKQKKRHKEHNRTHLMHNQTCHAAKIRTTARMGTNVSQRPITVQYQNFGPIAAQVQSCQPAIGQSPVSFQPMEGMEGCFYKPIGGNGCTESRPIGGLECSERAHIASECAVSPHGDTQNEAKTMGLYPSLPTKFHKADTLQDESKQALQELQAIQTMISSLDQGKNNNDLTNSVDYRKVLDRPTHIEAKPKPSPLSSRKPVLLKFYSMQYGSDAECTGTELQNREDDTHQVPKTPTSPQPTNLPRLPNNDGPPDTEDVYANILHDMDAMENEIERLNAELCHDLMEI